MMWAIDWRYDFDYGRYDEEGSYRRRWIHPRASSFGNVDEEPEDDDIEEEDEGDGGEDECD